MTQPVVLPAHDESVHCAEFARSHSMDPGGTALAPDAIVLVEVPEPWPKPVGKHSELVALVRAAADHPEQIRLLAAVPGEADHRRLIVFRPAAGGMSRVDMPLDLDDPVATLRAALGSGVSRVVLVDESDERTLLVCTQGSHDVCCGIEGDRLVGEIEAAPLDIEVFKVSHTGGHRFAPTAMSLPDGRMWAYLTLDAVEAILERTAGEADLAATSRGWWGVPTGPAQMAERAVFAELGWPLDRLERTVAVAAEPDGRYRVRVDVVGHSTHDVVIEVGRAVPTIACDKPGGLPVKPRHEWRVVSVSAASAG